MRVRCLTATVRLYGKEEAGGRLRFTGAVELTEVKPDECEGTVEPPVLQAKSARFLAGLGKGRKRGRR